MHEETINKNCQKNPKKDPNVVWQRHEGMTQKDANNTTTTMVNDEN
jgi:hypothetical protein